MPPTSGQAPALVVIRLSSFGDVVLAEPVTRVLKQRFPGSRLAFVTGRQYAALASLFPCVDTVVSYPGDGSDMGWEAGRAYDLAVDLQANRRSRRFLARTGATRVLRYRRPRFARFFTVYLPWVWKGPQPHTLETYFRTLGPLGIQYSDQKPAIRPDPGELKRVAEEVGEGPFVGICPGSSSPHKSWGESRFAQLISLLGQDQRVLLIGSEEDRPAVEAVVEEAGAHALAVYVGEDIGRIAAWLALCKVAVTNDSGLMHLAGAVGARPVAIFGPTSPLLGFAPAGEGSVVVSLGLKCSPCSYHGNRPCRLDRRYCMEGITPGHVASVVRKMMETEAGA